MATKKSKKSAAINVPEQSAEPEYNIPQPLNEAVVTAEAGTKPEISAQAAPLNDGIKAPVAVNTVTRSNYIPGSLPAARPLGEFPVKPTAQQPAPAQQQAVPAQQSAQQPAQESPEEAYQKAVKQAGASATTPLGNAGRQQVANLQSIADQYGKTMDQVIADAQASNAATERDFADIVLQQRRELEDAKAEDAMLAQQERSRAVWAGATEAASAIANLVGVGSFGASNQVYAQYSKDWMDKADANRRQRQTRVDSLSEKQRQLQQQLTSIRQGNQNSIFNMRLNQMKQSETERKNDAYVAYQTARTEGEYLKQELNQAKLQLEKDKNTIREAESKAKVREIESRIKKNDSQTQANYKKLQGDKDNGSDISKPAESKPTNKDNSIDKEFGF